MLVGPRGPTGSARFVGGGGEPSPSGAYRPSPMVVMIPPCLKLPPKNSQNKSKICTLLTPPHLWFSHKSSTEGNVQKNMLGHRMHEHMTIRWYGERRVPPHYWVGSGEGQALPRPHPIMRREHPLLKRIPSM